MQGAAAATTIEGLNCHFENPAKLGLNAIHVAALGLGFRVCVRFLRSRFSTPFSLSPASRMLLSEASGPNRAYATDRVRAAPLPGPSPAIRRCCSNWTISADALRSPHPDSDQLSGQDHRCEIVKPLNASGSSISIVRSFQPADRPARITMPLLRWTPTQAFNAATYLSFHPRVLMSTPSQCRAMVRLIRFSPTIRSASAKSDKCPRPIAGTR